MVRRLRLPSEPASATRAVHFAEEAGHAAGLPSEVVDRLVLAMGEAITNAIQHGNHLDAGRRIDIVWEGDASGGWLEVEDEGPGPDPHRIVTATLPEDPTQTNGRGLYLIRILTDAVVVQDGRLRMWFEARFRDPA